jgi:hypothetical protein
MRIDYSQLCGGKITNTNPSTKRLVLSPFAEIETLYGSTKGKDYEPVAVLSTGKCSPIKQ